MSTVRLWRLCRAELAAKTFTGEGPYLYGGRWSPPGCRLVYCAESRSLAAMEVLVHHVGTEIFRLTRWVAIPADVPEILIEKPARVPEAWRGQSPVAEVQRFGADWTRERRSAVLRVPSAVVLGEFNYLLNPAHFDFRRVKIGPAEAFVFDPRLGARREVASSSA